MSDARYTAVEIPDEQGGGFHAWMHELGNESCVYGYGQTVDEAISDCHMRLVIRWEEREDRIAELKRKLAEGVRADMTLTTMNLTADNMLLTEAVMFAIRHLSGKRKADFLKLPAVKASQESESSGEK